jgi:sugar phosphate isomerase/epimerase
VYDKFVQRRGFLTFAALAASIRSVRAASGRMQLHLSCGALGIKANQRQAIDLAAEHGFDAVDADGKYLAGLSDGELHDLLGYMESKKVAWAIAGLPVDIRAADDAFAAAMAQLPANSRALQRAGVRRVTTYILPMSNARPYLENFRFHAGRLAPAARILADSGIRVGLEYVAPKTLWASQRYPFVHTMAEMRELIHQIGQPNIGLVIDSWHWFHAGDSAADIAALRPADIVSIDLNDAPSGVPKDQMVDGKRELPASTGVIDVAAFRGALEKVGFDGPVRVEPFNEAVRQMAPDQAADAAIRGLHSAGF